MSENTAEKKRKATGKPFVKGDERINKNGRPKGSRNFSTLFQDAIKEIAENEGTDAEKELVLEAIKQAKEGKYQYHKDIFDRVYGQAEQKTQVQGEVSINLVRYDSDNDTA